MGERFDLGTAFARYEVRVYTYFRRMVPGRELARDLTQETFLRALRAAHRYRGEVPVDAWLIGIARNVFLEWLRRATRDRALAARPSAIPQASGPDEEAVDVERVMASLAPEHREVLVLRFALDLAGEEVARMLGISHGAVRQRVARAKAEFRREWEEG